MLKVVLIIVILAVVAAVMIVWARKRDIRSLSTHEDVPRDPVRDRPAGPSAESMDPDETGGHPSR